MFKKVAGAVAVATPFVIASQQAAAVAASVVPEAVITDFSGNGALTAAAVGGALLTLAGVVVLFKWAKAMFFG